MQPAASGMSLMRKPMQYEPGDAVVEVVEANVLQMTLPHAPFRAVGNIPFGITTPLFHQLLDDPISALVRADLVVQREVARKRAAVPPRNMLTLSWSPWWRFAITRPLPAAVPRAPRWKPPSCRRYEA